ncbi:unnamed protein product [Lampetra planeri]
MPVRPPRQNGVVLMTAQQERAAVPGQAQHPWWKEWRSQRGVGHLLTLPYRARQVQRAVGHNRRGLSVNLRRDLYCDIGKRMNSVFWRDAEVSEYAGCLMHADLSEQNGDPSPRERVEGESRKKWPKQPHLKHIAAARRPAASAPARGIPAQLRRIPSRRCDTH